MNISAISTVFVLACASAALPASAAENLTNSSIDWKGAYLGLHLGYAKGKANFSDNSYNGAPPFPTVSWSSKSGGSITGIHGGYNWRSHRTIYGLEGELGHLNLRGHALQPGTDPYLDPYDGYGTIGNGWYAGLSARLGYTFGRTLLYGKTGAIYSTSKLGFLDNCTATPCGNSTANASQRVGWGTQIGAGLEYAVTPR